MLVLGRKAGETLMIGDDVTVKVISISGGLVKIGIAAPNSVPVHREEVYLRIQSQKEAEGGQE